MPFNEADFYRVSVRHVESHEREGVPQGIVLLARDDAADDQAGEQERALLLVIAGDSLTALTALIQGMKTQRPLALELLWSVLEQVRARQPGMDLVRVAIVDLEDQVYKARLLFGDTDSGVVWWDCDCRPSDSLWLALRTKCPIYIRRSVWSEGSTLVHSLLGGGSGASREVTSADESGDRGAPAQNVRVQDPEPVKLLKRELGVAIAEEDYATAARLRDHPFMQIQSQIEEHMNQGRLTEAARLQDELAAIIKKHEQERN